MDAELARCLMWKWQEGLYARLPVTTDVLGFAHGPLQSFYDKRGTFITLRRDSQPKMNEVFERFRASLHPTRHQEVCLRAALPGPLAYFEFDAQLNAYLLAEIEDRGIDPETWPGQGADGPLYGLHEPP